MGDYAGICPCDDGNTRRARDWYSRLDIVLAHASHTQVTYVDDATPATGANTLSALKHTTAQLVLYFGHSTSDEWTRKGIATVDRTNVSAAKGKAVVSVSCKSGRNLGPDAVNGGGIKAWLGFTIKVPVIPPYGPDDPIGDAIVNGLAVLANGTMADARAALEAELRQSSTDYDTGGRYQHHRDALLGYFACGYLADNVSLSGDTALKPLAPTQHQPPGSTQQQPSSTRVKQSKPRYHYVLHMSGDVKSNGPFFSRLKSEPTVEAQSRLMALPPDGTEVTIFVWSSKPLDEVFSSIASETSTSILEITSSLA